jgi:hypothetical protein
MGMSKIQYEFDTREEAEQYLIDRKWYGKDGYTTETFWLNDRLPGATRRIMQNESNGKWINYK